MPTWTTPKTNWVGTDHFSAADWTRISGNTEYIANALSLYVPNLPSATDGQTVLTSDNRNSIVYLLNEIYEKLSASWNRGNVKYRIDYGAAWNSSDLNIIEDLLLNAKAQIDGEISGNDFYRCGEEICCGDTFSVGLL